MQGLGSQLTCTSHSTTERTQLGHKHNHASFSLFCSKLNNLESLENCKNFPKKNTSNKLASTFEDKRLYREFVSALRGKQRLASPWEITESKPLPSYMFKGRRWFPKRMNFCIHSSGTQKYESVQIRRDKNGTKCEETTEGWASLSPGLSLTFR